MAGVPRKLMLSSRSTMTFRKYFCVLCTLLMMTDITAQDDSQITSPNRRFKIQFHGSNPSWPESFTLVDGDQKVLFDSKSCPDLVDVVNFDPEHVLWSPDSQTAAIAGGYSKLLTTYLFTRKGGSFVNVFVPHIENGYDNPYILPLRWIKGRRLILGITGPHAGKSHGYSYRGRTTLYVPVNSGTCEVHYHYITDHLEKLTD
jgi:hypothetical protein